MSAKPRQFRKGQYLFREGDPPRSLFIVTKGTVSVRKSKAAGFIELATVHSNEVLGEMGFFDKNARSASAFAVTDVEVHEIDYLSLDKIYKSTPPYIRTMMNAVVERLRRADDAIRRLQKNVVDAQADSLQDSDSTAAVLEQLEGNSEKPASTMTTDEIEKIQEEIDKETSGT